MTSQSVRSLRNLSILVLFLLAGMTAAYYLKPDANNGTIAGSKLGGDFTMTTKQGEVSLSDFKGKVPVIYIGYASCPDVCPTSLGVLATALYQMTEEEQAQIQPIFISVDPLRDTPDKLDQYAKYFYPTMLGMTSDRANIDKVVRQYGSFYRIVEMEESELGYTVDHSSRLYIVGRKGNLVDTTGHNILPNELVGKLRQAIN